MTTVVATHRVAATKASLNERNALLPSAPVETSEDPCGIAIRQAATEQGLSRAQLAKKAGIKDARLKRCWRDGGQYTMPEIARIGAVLNVAPSYFFGGKISEKPVHLPTAEEAGVHLVPVSILGIDRPIPGDVVQVTTTEDPRGTVKLRFHLSKDLREEGLSWTSEEGVLATVGGTYEFLGSIDCPRQRYVLLGILPTTDDGNRGD